jgi:predicted AlkP superfamily phosphohydrolase/phosphomutase
MARTFVVGLDGASWRLLEPWLEDGTLPNIAALRAENTWAETESCLPPVTFPNWKCYSAGKNPGGLGVFWFEHVDLDAGRIDVAEGGDFETAELWDYLAAAGQTPGVVNMPTMYPPRDIGGPVVCGGPDAVQGEYRQLDSGYTSPSTLEDELNDRFGYRVHPEPLLSGNDERGAEVDAILDVIDSRFEVALTLFEERELDFVHVTLFYLNVLQHFFWNDTPTRRAWELIDDWLGEIADMKGVNLVLMSDHGSGPTTTEFYVNEWLAENGYQRRERTIEDALRPLGLTRENVLGLAKRAGIVDLLATTVPERLQQLVPQSAGVKRERKLEAIDLAGTQAVASGQGPIYLTPGTDESVRERLIEDLRAVEDEDGPLFAGVYKGEAVYSGRYVDRAPEVVVDMRPGVHVNDGIGGGEVQTAPDRWAAENTRHGIFLASGPDFTREGQLDRISILDMAPTLLAAHGCAIPTDMDGEVLPIHTDDHDVGQQDPIDIGADAGRNADDAVADRLKQLGYME